MLRLIAQLLPRCLDKLGQKSVCAVGCAAPGMTDAQKGIVLDAANLPGWVNVPLASLLANNLGVATFVENDVNAAALAEAATGAGRGCHSVVFMTISTGVAAGIVVEGQLVRGAHHSAGELGNIVPDPRHLDQDWAPNGCLESTAAGVGLASSWLANTGDQLSSEQIFGLADAGNAAAERLVARATDYLAQAALALGSILDPERLILGGAIGLRQPRVSKRIDAVLRSALPAPPEVVPAALGDHAPLVGALMLAAR